MVLGPMLRYVGPTEATVWLETSAACEAEVLSRRARTFAVQGHHYALVVLDGLEPGRAYGYEVRLDGDPAWPEPGSRFPPSVLRTLGGGRPLRLAFGSCRVAAPTEPRWRRFPDGQRLGVDALRALALRLARSPAGDRPHLLAAAQPAHRAAAPGLAARDGAAGRMGLARHRPPGRRAGALGQVARRARAAVREPGRDA